MSTHDDFMSGKGRTTATPVPGASVVRKVDKRRMKGR